MTKFPPIRMSRAHVVRDTEAVIAAVTDLAMLAEDLADDVDFLRGRLARARKMVDIMLEGNSEFHLCATTSVRDDLRALQDVLGD